VHNANLAMPELTSPTNLSTPHSHGVLTIVLALRENDALIHFQSCGRSLVYQTSEVSTSVDFSLHPNRRSDFNAAVIDLPYIQFRDENGNFRNWKPIQVAVAMAISFASLPFPVHP